MTHSSLHTCNMGSAGSSAESLQTTDEVDCSACQLAQLCHTGKAAKVQKSDRSMAAVEEDDYSISTELTQKGNDYSILYLVIAAAGVLAVVVLAYRFFLL